MKLLLLPILSGICILPMNNQTMSAAKPAVSNSHLLDKGNGKVISEINFQELPGYGRISTVSFKNQDYCRAELKDFEFDAHFSIVSATVYFTGANFKTVEKGFLTSSSLKPVKNLMAKCLPGTIVVFDDVKVKGPDNEIRTIQGVTLTLY